MKVNNWALIIVLIAVAVIGVVYSQIFMPQLAPRQIMRNCVMPSAYPNLITQSGSICPGNYNFGIGIGADNVSINCSTSNIFYGTGWNGNNGLVIQGVENVSIQGCTFVSFNKNGVFVGNGTN